MNKRLTKRNATSFKGNNSLTDKASVDTLPIKTLTSDSRSSVLFKVAVTEVLQSPFTFEKLKGNDIKEFSRFLKKTVGEHLSISDVEKLYLRTGGPHGAKNREVINGKDKITYHFSNGSRDFRVHGYYNEESYFCLTRIDPHHKYKFL